MVQEAGGVNPKDLIGAKKAPVHLVPPTLVIETAEAFKDGAEKYGPYNWREKPVKASVYYAAFLRHVASWFDGEDFAEDSKVKHLAHASACLAIILDAAASGTLVDDRPSPGGSARLLAESAKMTEQVVSPTERPREMISPFSRLVHLETLYCDTSGCSPYSASDKPNPDNVVTAHGKDVVQAFADQLGARESWGVTGDGTDGD